MWKGKVVAINIASETGQPTHAVSEIRAIPGKGLEGDRYFLESGRYSKKPGPDREVTLISLEALEALALEHGIQLDAGQTRRNIATRSAPLNDLVDREFYVGGALLRGIKLCHPCSYLESQTQEGVLAGLAGRGGLRAQVLREGVIRVGDVVSE